MTTADELRSRIAGKPGVVGATIITRSGLYFDFINPDPATIRVEDIAAGLANTCRFGGQSLAYYSVAQHSVLVSRVVAPELALTGLMHDAAEAYVGDIVGPLKQLLPDYKAIETRVEEVIAAAGAGDNWNGLDEWEPLPDRIEPLLPDAAMSLFLERFDELRGW